PHYVIRVVESAVGGTLRIRDARLSFPLTATLLGVRNVNSSPESSFSIQKIVITPRWVSVPSKTIWLETVRIEQPLLRISRSGAGAMAWPALPTAAMTDNRPSNWRLHINSLEVVDGTIELVDQQLSPPFHGVLHHVSVAVGPVAVPWTGSQMSFAVRGELVGHAGEAAPLYCSGWADVAAQGLQAMCQLEPLALAAFEPYYQQRKVKVRVYQTTLKSTSQWRASSNELEGRIQVELGNLTEGDVSIGGRTIVDVKNLAPGEAPRLSAEFTIAGPLNDPSDWRSEFVPGDAAAQQLVEPLLERGIEIINIPWGEQKIQVSITPATPTTMSTIEETSKQVQQDLEMLAEPTETPTAPEQPATPPVAAEVAPQPPAPPELPPAPAPLPSGGS
ncbi:MAG: DUF748 domain-containing protein, partial [Candidatus Omnitrophota bacterium]|nr:DUF748 domain-containing protein [Candidatus Omnitrophota bacterium]